MIFKKSFLENPYLFENKKDAPGKSVSIWKLKKSASRKLVFWIYTFLENCNQFDKQKIFLCKNVICLMNKYSFLENIFFSFWKISICLVIKPSGKVWKKRTDVFKNCLSVCCLCWWLKSINIILTTSMAFELKLGVTFFLDLGRIPLPVSILFFTFAAFTHALKTFVISMFLWLRIFLKF